MPYNLKGVSETDLHLKSRAENAVNALTLAQLFVFCTVSNERLMAIVSIKSLLARHNLATPQQFDAVAQGLAGRAGGGFAGYVAGVHGPRTAANPRRRSCRTWPRPWAGLLSTWPKQKSRPRRARKSPPRSPFNISSCPVKFEDGRLQVAVSNPFDAAMLSAVQFDARVPVQFGLATKAEIEKALKKYYGVGAETLDEMAKDDEPLELLVEDKEITEGDQEASVIKFVNQIIWEAFKDRATDIHFEPAEDELRIRYRIDGILHQTPMPPQLKRFQASLISRIKVMSGMNIAEKRLPQDGRINVRIKGEEIDIRVSTVPTVYGESVSLRLLTRGKIFLSLDKLGFAPTGGIAHPRNHRQAARHFPGHRPDRFGQIHFALRVSEHDQFGHQAHHHH